MAAAYLFHLCQNHAFVDGNKRVSLAACLVFLDLNSIFLEDSDDSFYNMVIDVTLGKIGKSEIASLLRKAK